jgi:hypothetical protein
MTEWQYFPRTAVAPEHLTKVVTVFDSASPIIGSASATLVSNKVLAAVAPLLASDGYRVETGAAHANKVRVPVLFGRNGRAAKTFEVDAYSEAEATVIEVEAGRAVVNNQFLKDLFEACVMPTVNFLVICVRSDYRGTNDFEKVCSFLDTLFASDRFRLPLTCVLVIGY